MGRVKRFIDEFLAEAAGVERCFVCGGRIHDEGVSREVNFPGEGNAEDRQFHADCWDRE